MTEDFLAHYPNTENFIPGIYNYCDRWCERCPFTDRCMNYAMEKRRWAIIPREIFRTLNLGTRSPRSWKKR